MDDLMFSKKDLFPPLNKFVVIHDLPKIEQGKNIPKIIHQTYKTRNLPQELEINVIQLKQKNPGWEYRFYNDSDIIQFISIFYGPDILTYYEKINPNYGAARADLFRYLLLYKYGGVYLDIKSTLSKPIDEILQSGDQYLLANWANEQDEEHEGWGLYKELSTVAGGEFQQWHIIAVPGHPFLRAVIDSVLTNIDCYKPWLHGTGRRGVLCVTGPIAYTLAIYPILYLHPHRLVRTNAELSLVYSILNESYLHRSLLKTHYQTLTDSVIKVDGIDKVIFQLYSLARKIKRGSQISFLI